VQDWFKRITAEARNAPVGFAGGFLGLVTIAYNSALLQGFMSQTPTFSLNSDLGYIAMLCAFLLAQGTVGTVLAPLQVLISRMGPGFGLVLFVVSSVFLSWLVAFNSYWMTVSVPHGSSIGPILFAAYIVASWFFVAYFQILQFRKALRSVSPGLLRHEFDGQLNFWARRLYAALIMDLFLGIAMFVYFGMRLSP
jgi:vacuolar-type H+-ATPase subunit I/STV1